MNTTTINNWHEANQRYLMAAVGVVREELELHRPRVDNYVAENKSMHAESSVAQKKLKQAAGGLPAPAALDTLTALFCLTPFERNVLLMCAGLELDSTFATLCASTQGDPRCPYPTFSLALAALPDAHWSALSPNAPLRYWRLIEVGTGAPLTKSPLRIDERMLHYLAGISHMDEQLAGIVEPLFAEGDLVPSHHKLADRLIQVWSQSAGKLVLPVIQLCGDEVVGKRAIAAAACTRLGLNLSTDVCPCITEYSGRAGCADSTMGA